MSKRKILISIIALVLSFAMLFTAAACKQDTNPSNATEQAETPKNTLNETKTLIVQESTFDGVFSPFFYSSAYDGDVVGFVNVGLLTVDATGAVVAGPQYDTVAQSYSIFYTSDLNGYTPKETYEEGDYVVYEMVLKNGAKFSDGTAISADDVLFNYYVLLDPAYVGSSTLYTLPILGLAEYRTQTTADENAALAAKAATILAAGRGEGYAANDDFTEEEYNNYWESMDVAGKAFAQEIVTYVNGKYKAYNGGEYTDNYTFDLATEGGQIAFGMIMWGFGGFNDAGKFIGAVTGEEFDLETTFPTIETYWENLQAGYADEDGETDYQNLSDTESAGADLIANASSNFISASANVGSIKSIAGLVKGETTVDGEKHETVKVILTQQNPKAILSLGVTVAPKAYYTAGYSYTDGALVNAGVELGINGNDKFMQHLQTLNSAPAGAGCYKFVSADGDGVTLVRNDYHYTLGNDNVTNAKIKNVYLKVIESGKEYDALKAGDVDYANPSADKDVVAEIATKDDLTSILVDNLGYGYICVNPAAADYGFNNIYTRIALTTVFDLSKVNEYYPSGLADVIYRSQSQVSWAYPEGASATYPFDETLASAIENFKKAGYTFDEEEGKFTDVPELDFFLPSDASDHPAGPIFLRAQELLATIGVTVNIKVDSDLIANIKKKAVPVYALAWQSSQDPDMYQVYHYLSQAESVTSNGIKKLYEIGDNDDLGTIEVKKLDGTTETLNQKEALAYLAELIEEGVKYMSVEERKPIYEKALEVLAQLNIEVPTYQRKNMFAYNNAVIEAASLSQTVTPYWGPMAELWKVSFVNGDAEIK